MKILYPPLVEQGIAFYQSEHLGNKLISKAEMYVEMVQHNIITETGLPTAYALENGLVKDFYEEENLTFQEFLNLYPVFADFSEEIFQNIEGFWEIPVSIKNDLIDGLKRHEFTYDEEMQIEAYLSDR